MNDPIDRDAQFPAARAWNARWIRHALAPDRNAYVLIRHEFQTDGVPRARLFITADTGYRLRINGSLVGDGPPQSQPYHQYYWQRYEPAT